MAKVLASISGRPAVFGLASIPLVFVLVLLAVVIWVSAVDDISEGFAAGKPTFDHFAAKKHISP